MSFYLTSSVLLCLLCLSFYISLFIYFSRSFFHVCAKLMWNEIRVQDKIRDIGRTYFSSLLRKREWVATGMVVMVARFNGVPIWNRKANESLKIIRTAVMRSYVRDSVKGDDISRRKINVKHVIHPRRIHIYVCMLYIAYTFLYIIITFANDNSSSRSSRKKKLAHKLK